MGMIFKTNKRGIYFTLDAFFSTILLLIGVILITKYSFQEVSTEQIDMLSKDLLTSFGELKVGEINHPWVESLINEGVIVNPNNSIVEQIGSFWSEDTDLSRERAENLTTILVDDLTPSRYGLSVVMINADGSEREIFSRNKTGEPINLVSSKRMITGVVEGEVSEGSTSSAYVRKIRNKKTSSYIYFGGFVGQGNITVFMDNIPFDVNSDAITDITLELDPAESFDFLINNQMCNSSLPAPTINMSPLRWNMTHCKNLTVLKKNNFSINFPSMSNFSYISGGYIKLTYLTNQTQENISRYSKNYYFPDIDGLINIYDGFYIPGILNDMELRLHYYSNHSVNNSNFSTYLTIGNIMVFNDSNSTIEQDIILNNSVLSSLLNYSFLSQKTVPIRLSSYEYQFEEIITGGNADVILITDLSGSMKKSVIDWNLGNAAPTCDEYMVNPDTRRTRAVVCLNKELINVIMNYSGNRVWPIYMKNDEVIFNDVNSSDIDAIKADMDLYYNDQGAGKTCLACAINKAYELLDANSDMSRSKFVVIMTDGVPTHCAEGSCQSTSSVYGILQCEGMCDTSGFCGYADIGDQCLDCTASDGAVNNTYYSANRTRKDLNATIYSIGFGPVIDCLKANETLKRVAEIGNGTYSHSNNVSVLQTIYQTIAYDILERTTQISQIVVVLNDTPIGSKLFGDSNILLNYTPVSPELEPSEVSVVFQTPQFNTCNPTIDIPPGLRVADARITSYSGEHWNDLLTVNNQTVFSLQDFSDNYLLLGDPFHVEIPPGVLINGINNISIRTADSPTNITGCSDNNTLIYRAMINFSSTRSEVKEFAEGCTWIVEFEDGAFDNLSIPKGYSGSNNCSYTNNSISYNLDDAYDVSIYRLLDDLDFDDDGRVLFNFASEDLEIIINVLEGIRYIRTPSLMDVRVWQ